MAAYNPQHAIRADSTFDTSNLKGKSVIITGGASGLGEAFARTFVKHGAFVTIGDISPDRGEALVSKLGGAEKAAFVKCDVLDWNDQVNLFKTAISKSSSRSIDCVIANAGISGQDEVFNDTGSGPDGDEPVEPDLRILKINLVGVAYTVKLALHYLPRQHSSAQSDKCLIITASLAGYLDLPGSPQYAASKWGVRGIMRALRQTTPLNGVRVNIIAPWFVRTGIMSKEMADSLVSRGIDFCDIEDAASAVMHLASDKTINGRSLAVLPRKVDKRGYADLMKDDYDSGEQLDVLQQLVGTHRIGTDQAAQAAKQ